MKYVYIGKKYDGDSFRDSFGHDINSYLKQWLEVIIFTEQPYLADSLNIESSDEELSVLLKMCRFFSAVLRNEHPKPLNSSEWSLEFEGKHHGLIGLYFNFIHNIYQQD